MKFKEFSSDYTTQQVGLIVVKREIVVTAPNDVKDFDLRLVEEHDLEDKINELKKTHPDEIDATLAIVVWSGSGKDMITFSGKSARLGIPQSKEARIRTATMFRSLKYETSWFL